MKSFPFLIIASKNPVTSLHLEESRRKGKTIVLIFHNCVDVSTRFPAIFPERS